MCRSRAFASHLSETADQITGFWRVVMSMMSVMGTKILSSIANWVCPDCGGRMGGHGKEFKCQGECQKDWRETWEQRYSAERGYRPSRLVGHRRTQL